MFDSTQIREHMEVLGSDGTHVGTVDHVEGGNKIKLTKSDPAAKGQHHYIPGDWVSRVDEHVHLSKKSADVFQNWQAA